MSMKKIIIMMVVAVMATTAMGQLTHTATGTVDENAEKVLKKAHEMFEKSSGISFDVTMVSRDSQKKETGRQKAKVLYSKGKYRVEMADGTLYCDGKSTWHWNKGTKEVMVNTISTADDDLMNPARLLANYKKNFKAKYIRQDADGTDVVDLTPKKAKSYHKIRLLINSKNSRIKRMEIHNYDSSEGLVDVSNVQMGVKCGDKDFVFDSEANKGVEIIDMR